MSDDTNANLRLSATSALLLAPETTAAPSLTAWRSEVALRGRTDVTQLEGVVVSKLEPDLTACTAAVQHESENWLAVAGTGKKRDLVRLLDVTPAGKRHTVDFTILSGARQSSAVTALALRETQLAVASEGTVQLYHCSSSELTLLHALAAPKRDDYSGYYRSSSSRPIDTLNALASLELVPEARVLAVRGPEVLVWALNGNRSATTKEGNGATSSQVSASGALNSSRRSALYQSKQYSATECHLVQLHNTPGTVVKWCQVPLVTGQGSVHHECFLFGNINGDVKLYDYRLLSQHTKASIAAVRRAHQAPLTAAAWSPHVPYWCVTGAADGRVLVWDARHMSAPVTRLETSRGAVKSLQWSTNHAELLAIGADRHVTLTSLLTTQPVLSLVNQGGVLHGGLVAGQGRTLLAVSTFGEVTAATMTDSFLASAAPTTPGEDPALVAIRQQIYARQFDKAFTTALEQAKQLHGEARVSEALTLVDLCAPSRLPDPVPAEREGRTLSRTSSVREVSRDQIVAQYTRAVYDYATHIPPNFPQRMWPKLDSKVLFEIEVFKVNLELESYIAHEQCEELIVSHGQVMRYLKKSAHSIKSEVLWLLLGKVMQYDYLSALDMGYDYAVLLSATSEAFVKCAHLLLYPTIYDHVTLAPSKKSATSKKEHEALLTAFKKQSGTVPAELNILRKLYKALWANDRATLKTLLREIKSPLLSASANRMLCAYLLNEEQFDQFYARIVPLIELTKNYPHNAVFAGMLTDSIDRLKKYIVDVPSRVNTSSNPSASALKDNIDIYRRALVTLVTIIGNAEGLPRGVTSTITKSLKSLGTDLDKWLRDLRAKDDSSATKLAREMSAELRALVKSSDVSEEVTALCAALDRSDDKTDAKSGSSDRSSSSRRTDSDSRRSTRDRSRDDK